MGWTGGRLDGPFSSRAAIAFDLGDAFADRVIDTARYGRVIYAAVRSGRGDEVFGLVLLAERAGGVLYTKPISEDMGPAEDGCPARILALLTEPSDDNAREWRRRCRERLARPRPRKGETVAFESELSFTDGSTHRELVYLGGSRFRPREGGTELHVASWREMAYRILG
jgi:hypothetical protein